LALKTIVKCGEGYALQVFWSRDEWCKRLPRWWLELAEGCSRCTRVTLLATLAYSGHPVARLIVEQLCENGYAVLEDGKWVVRLEEEHRACIYPWPKNLFLHVF